MAVFDDGEPWERKLMLYKHKVELRDGIPSHAKADGEPVIVEQAEPLKLECQHFLDCILNRATPRTDGYEGVRVLKVLQAAHDAMEAQQKSAKAAA
jgi:UDP-2-acetamido-3-amino-2,3-dideoxy-glucuronate N-acetyltransferase